jgi:hypothetical protein
MKGRMEALARLFLVSMSVPVKKAELVQRWRANFQILRISRRVAQSPRQANVGGRLVHFIADPAKSPLMFAANFFSSNAANEATRREARHLIARRHKAGSIVPRGFTVNQQDASLRATRNLRVALDRNRHDRVRHLDNSNF